MAQGEALPKAPRKEDFTQREGTQVRTGQRARQGVGIRGGRGHNVRAVEGGSAWLTAVG